MQTKSEFPGIADTALYTARLIIHGTQIARHTLFPSQEEAQVTTLMQRAQVQIEKRAVDMANDLASIVLNR
ncbi:hypothetical protein [Legionella erythra]|uniref:Uncharacterized protein n=1 Tax=Legionella erythra TaxID=448 RepID=A0A0W0TJC5_LEGER|nr:hypothetical protein [Legionella erythra]KTC95672.1 hypothetical protein Lery_1967 [Legionella erythra]